MFLSIMIFIILMFIIAALIFLFPIVKLIAAMLGWGVYAVYFAFIAFVLKGAISLLCGGINASTKIKVQPKANNIQKKKEITSDLNQEIYSFDRTPLKIKEPKKRNILGTPFKK